MNSIIDIKIVSNRVSEEDDSIDLIAQLLPVLESVVSDTKVLFKKQ